MKLAIFAAALSIFSGGGPGHAPDPDTDPRLAAIAAGDVDALVAPYAPDAVLEWVGGPLDGSYRGAAELRSVWTRFAGAQGPLEIAAAESAEHANPQGRTISTDVVFIGSSALRVHHVQTWRGDRLAHEIWQIDPGEPAY